MLYHERIDFQEHEIVVTQNFCVKEWFTVCQNSFIQITATATLFQNGVEKY